MSTRAAKVCEQLVTQQKLTNARVFLLKKKTMFLAFRHANVSPTISALRLSPPQPAPARTAPLGRAHYSNSMPASPGSTPEMQHCKPHSGPVNQIQGPKDQRYSDICEAPAATRLSTLVVLWNQEKAVKCWHPEV